MTTTPMKTEGVDISPEAVERAASGAELNGQRWLAEMLRELSRSLTASEKRRRETDMLAYKWMVAHDRLAAGLQYEFPSPANIPDALARVNELETFVRSVQVPTKDGTWKEVMFRLADEARVILAKGERS